MIAEKTYKALKALENGTYSHGINARAVAVSLWADDAEHKYLFSACSKQGNGACRGKKAWLCAGSIIGKLRKRNLVHYDSQCTAYYLTQAGRNAIAEYELQNNIGNG